MHSHPDPEKDGLEDFGFIATRKDILIDNHIQFFRHYNSSTTLTLDMPQHPTKFQSCDILLNEAKQHPNCHAYHHEVFSQ